MSNFGDHPAGFFGDSSFYNGVAKQSLRFDAGSSPYLTRTPSSASNRRTFTFSVWIKRGVLDGDNVSGSNDTPIFSASSANGQPVDVFRTMSHLVDGANILMLYANPSGSTDYSEETNASIRDTSAWYHIVMAVDTTQSTAGNRVKFYINGTLQTAVGQNYAQIPQNHDFHFNNTVAQEIGRNAGNTGRYFDGYMAEVNFVDGTQYDASYFGETKNGVWIAKTPNVTYGTNGYRLQFKNTGTGTASASTIGADTSGNTNHFTSSGIVASDCNMPDSPENGFANINPLNVTDSTSPTFSEGNLKTVVSNDGSKWGGSSTIGASSGKYYFEVLATQSSNVHIGVADETAVREGARIDDHNVTTGGNAVYYRSNDGNKRVITNGSQVTSSYASTYTTTDIIGVAFDVDGSEVTFFKNNSSLGAITIPTTTENLFIALSGGTGNAQNTFHLNAGADSSFAGNKTAQGNTDGNGIGDFYYAPPSGFLALCTANLPEPTISPNAGDGEQADDYFNTVLYSGNGGTNAITGVGFQPDFVWTKLRSQAGSHSLADVIRGGTAVIRSDLTNAEVTRANHIQSFDSDGFTLGADGTSNLNGSTNVAWNWKANGTGVSNTDGSITSTVSANTDAGFSIVTYTGNGSAGATVGHSLGTKPEMIILKERNASGNWVTYHEYANANAQNGYIALNLTSAWTSNSASWNNTSPTSSVFTLGNGTDVNTNNHTMLAYCFHSVVGYSKLGTYIGNSSSTGDGTFVYLGFKPSFVMLKDIGGGEWGMFDNTRNTFNVVNKLLNAQSNGAEYSGDTNRDLDFLSNGFKLRNGSALVFNNSARTYIYMAFAETSFKYALGR